MEFNPLDFLEVPLKLTSLDPVPYQYFNSLLNHRTIILNEEIDEHIIETVILPLKQLEKDGTNKPVTLILNTPGGSLVDGLSICSLIDNYTIPLEIFVPSYSCSMGTIILCSGNNNPNVTKTAYPFAFALFHCGQTYVGGDTNAVKDTMDFNQKIEDKIKNYVISNTKITEELYEKNQSKQWYLTADEMLEYGLIDKIIRG